MIAVRETLRVMRIPALVLALAGLIYVVLAWHRPVERVGERLTSSAVALKGVAEAADSAILREIDENDGYERVWIVDGAGLIAASSHPLEAGRKVESPWLEMLVNASGPGVLEGRDWGSRHIFLAAHRSAHTGRWGVVLQDGQVVKDGRHRLIVFTLVSVIGIVLLISAATYLALEKNLLQPLGRLETAAESTLSGQSGELDRLVDGTPIGRIATALAEKSGDCERFAAELKERRALYFSVLNLAREMVLITSFDGEILEINRSFSEKLGIDRAAAVGRPLSDLDKQLPSASLIQLGERSAREQRVFDRLILSFTGKAGAPMRVVAAVQAVPFGGKPAFMMVADDRTNEEALAVQVSELLRPVTSTEENTGEDGGDESP